MKYSYLLFRVLTALLSRAGVRFFVKESMPKDVRTYI